MTEEKLLWMLDEITTLRAQNAMLREKHFELPTRKPLSDEAVCQILLKKEWKGFVELVRAIEKEHGIEN